jgi:CBS domain-containing membrane protein
MWDKPVAEIMTANPEAVDAGDTLLSVKKIYEKHQFHHHIPVTRNGRLEGMISLYDFILAIRGASLDDDEPVYQEKRASDIMSRDVVSCSPSATVHEVIDLFNNNSFHAIPVVLHEKLVGIVTTHDLLRLMAGL